MDEYYADWDDIDEFHGWLLSEQNNAAMGMQLQESGSVREKERVRHLEITKVINRLLRIPKHKKDQRGEVQLPNSWMFKRLWALLLVTLVVGIIIGASDIVPKDTIVTLIELAARLK